jgi:benzylsuccinate CoA-transferase BbsE subunit
MKTKSMLGDLRVIDLSDEKGWFCGKLLADMGAEVIRPEKSGSPNVDEYANCGKKRISLDIEKPAGSDLFKKLVQSSQVLIESLTPGYLSSLGLDYVVLKELNPGLIMVSISPFGQSGPRANYRSSALTAAAAGGQLFLNGEPGRPPLPLFGPQAYLTASLFAANTVLIALQVRNKSGLGQYADISIQECAAGTLDHALVRYWYNGEVASRTGDLYWNKAFKIMPCKDGYILLTFNQNWETLVGWLEGEGMAEDLTQPEWQSADYRLAHLQHIFEVLGKWTLTHNADELMETAQLMRLPWAKVAQPVFSSVPPVKMSASPWQVVQAFSSKDSVD